MNAGESRGEARDYRANARVSSRMPAILAIDDEPRWLRHEANESDEGNNDAD